MFYRKIIINGIISIHYSYFNMKFSIGTKEKCDVFAHIFQTIKSLTDITNICFSKERMFIQTMDKMSISICEVSLDKDWFTEYVVDDCEEDEDITIGINVAIFCKILNVRGDKSTIQCSFDSEEDRLQLNVLSGSNAELDKVFGIPLVDIDPNYLDIPDADYNANVTLVSKNWKQTVDEIAQFGDIITITCNGEGFTLEAANDDTTMKTLLPNEKLVSYEFSYECDEDDDEDNADFSISSGYSSRYLTIIAQGSKWSSNVSVHITENMPIRIVYSIDENSYVNMFLAPKMD